jgi:hypothetical protein
MHDQCKKATAFVDELAKANSGNQSNGSRPLGWKTYQEMLALLSIESKTRSKNSPICSGRLITKMQALYDFARLLITMRLSESHSLEPLVIEAHRHCLRGLWAIETQRPICRVYCTLSKMSGLGA